MHDSIITFISTIWCPRHCVSIVRIFPKQHPIRINSRTCTPPLRRFALTFFRHFFQPLRSVQMNPKVLSLAELLPDNISASVDDPFDRCVYVEGIRSSLTSPQFCYIMTKAFGPVSEHRVFATAHGSRTGVCIFATRHSATVAAGTFILGERGDLLARRFMDALGDDASIHCYAPLSGPQPSFCPLGLLSSSTSTEEAPRIICLEDELTVQPTTPLTSRTPTTTASGSYEDDATPRRSTIDEFKDAAKKALQLLLLEADDNLCTVDPSGPGLVNEDDLRRRFPLGRRVGDINDDNSSSDEQCIQQ